MSTTKRFSLSTVVPLLITTLISGTGAHSTSKQKVHYEPTWESLSQHEATPQWYQDAVLGFYFHWGPYSVPAFSCSGYWTMYQKGSRTYRLVKKKYGEPGVEFGYKDFVPMWKADKYDPDEWARLFKYAGADFAGPGAEHHDGFALWDTEFDEWNSVDMGPGIDIVGTLVEAVRKQGMKTCIALHNWRTYITYDTGRRLCPKGVDVNNEAYTGLYGPIHEPTHEIPINNEYPGADWPYSHWEERLNKWKELVDKYQIDLIWCEHMDSGEPPETMKKEMLAYYFNAAQKWDKEVVVTCKKLWENRRQDLPPAISPINREIGVLNHPRPQKWQTDIPLGRTWAYTPRVGCKDTDEIVDLIVNNVSKNGLTLFSVAPKPDGTLPAEQVEGLKKLGDWMAINKPALHGTVPAPFVMGGTDKWEYGSLRFTRKKEYLYVIALEKPTVPLFIPDLQPLEGSEIIMLGSDKPLKWHMEEDEDEEEDDDRDNLVIEEIPNPLPCDYAWSFKIQIFDKSW
ncbi:MAG: alpha-L-fucosidase [Planctomycetota bacterium]|jgi:alpha-L-fucosidase